MTKKEMALMCVRALFFKNFPEENILSSRPLKRHYNYYFKMRKVDLIDMYSTAMKAINSKCQQDAATN